MLKNALDVELRIISLNVLGSSMIFGGPYVPASYFSGPYLTFLFTTPISFPLEMVSVANQAVTPMVPTRKGSMGCLWTKVYVLTSHLESKPAGPMMVKIEKMRTLAHSFTWDILWALCWKEIFALSPCPPCLSPALGELSTLR